jgi:hypothetical protein
MNVIAFQTTWPDNPWRASEFREILQGFGPALARGWASGWEVATTEQGDPQFYLLGPLPHQHCIVCVSRIGDTYVLNDGEGRSQAAGCNLRVLLERSQRLARRGLTGAFAQIALAWYGARHAFHDKFEAWLAEGEEILAHIAPQLAVLA